MGRKHTLKTDPQAFDAVAAGEKTFEIRKGDRNYAVGDTLELRKTRYTGAQMAAGHPLEYTGEALTVSVSHIMRGPVWGLSDGWVILSIGRPTA